MFGRIAAIAAALALLVAAPTALAATKDTATAQASPGPYQVGEPITFTSTTPCTTACRLIWTYLNGTRLGDQLGEGVSVVTSFSTPGWKTVQLRLTELCVGTTRLTCASVAYVSVFVEGVVVPADTTAPTFTASGLEAEATGPNTVVNYTFDATDPDDAVVSQSCTPEAGSSFPVGSTPIDCTAVDSHGNVGAASFTVIVSDTTPPVLTVPESITVNATSPAGAVVAYTATANDVVDGTVTPSCSTPSGATFAIGTTTVSCTATDSNGNTTAAQTFTVRVDGAAEQLADVLQQVEQWNLRDRSVSARLQKIIDAVTTRSPQRACRELGDFVDDLSGSLGKRLTQDQVAWLRGELTRIGNVLGCSFAAR
jgi:hypothetical protein